MNEKKKGLPVLAWVGIGCGVLVLLGVIGMVGLVGFGVKKAKEVVGDFQDNPAKAAALLAVRVNPELELVETDDQAGTITIRNTEDGELFTLNFADMAEGRFSVTTDEGEITFDGSQDGSGGVTVTDAEGGQAHFGASADLEGVPEWVPLYPGASEVQRNYLRTAANEVSGAISAQTTDSLDEVFDYFREILTEQGYEVTSQKLGSGDSAFVTVGGEKGERTVSVMVNHDPSGSNRLIVTFEGPVAGG